ncbi:hypothetical protein [Streptomyces sp. NPDC002685]|uniref:hypothetical protein n=1 Tax=Streptomyces sp. NPDC002685 TaxID=3154540 RepID=UPI003328F175
MSMVAEASVRHWTVAFKAVQEGHTLIALRKVDAAIFWTPNETPPDKPDRDRLRRSEGQVPPGRRVHPGR